MAQKQRKLKNKGQRLAFKTQNVTDDERIEKVFDDIVKIEGSLDGLVCIALRPIAQTTEEGNNLYQRRNSPIVVGIL
jgi:hypothetical protein